VRCYRVLVFFFGVFRWARALAWAFRVMPVSTTMDQEPMSG
jgi:hypothetical protein